MNVPENFARYIQYIGKNWGYDQRWMLDWHSKYNKRFAKYKNEVIRLLSEKKSKPKMTKQPLPPNTKTLLELPVGTKVKFGAQEATIVQHYISDPYRFKESNATHLLWQDGKKTNILQQSLFNKADAFSLVQERIPIGDVPLGSEVEIEGFKTNPTVVHKNETTGNITLGWKEKPTKKFFWAMDGESSSAREFLQERELCPLNIVSNIDEFKYGYKVFAGTDLPCKVVQKESKPATNNNTVSTTSSKISEVPIGSVIELENGDRATVVGRCLEKGGAALLGVKTGEKLKQSFIWIDNPRSVFAPNTSYSFLADLYNYPRVKWEYDFNSAKFKVIEQPKANTKPKLVSEPPTKKNMETKQASKAQQVATFKSIQYIRYIGYNSETKKYEYEYKIKDENFEWLGASARAGAAGAGSSAGAALIKCYEEKNLPVPENFAAYIKYINDNYSKSGYTTDWMINHHSQYNEKFAKYKDEVLKILGKTSKAEPMTTPNYDKASPQSGNISADVASLWAKTPITKDALSNQIKEELDKAMSFADQLSHERKEQDKTLVNRTIEATKLAMLMVEANTLSEDRIDHQINEILTWPDTAIKSMHSTVIKLINTQDDAFVNKVMRDVEKEEDANNSPAPDATATTNTPSFTTTLKSEIKDAGYRVAATKLTQAIKTGILALLKGKGIEEGKINLFADLLDTEIGSAFISALLGHGLPYVPKLNEDERVKRLAEEFRVGAYTIVGNEVVSSLMEHLLPAISGALKELPSEETVRVSDQVVKETVKPIEQTLKENEATITSLTEDLSEEEVMFEELTNTTSSSSVG